MYPSIPVINREETLATTKSLSTSSGSSLTSFPLSTTSILCLSLRLISGPRLMVRLLVQEGSWDRRDVGKWRDSLTAPANKKETKHSCGQFVSDAVFCPLIENPVMMLYYNTVEQVTSDEWLITNPHPSLNIRKQTGTGVPNLCTISYNAIIPEHASFSTSIES